jgi:hypothetical protein
VKVVTVDEWRSHALRKMDGDSAHQKAKNFRLARAKLVDEGFVEALDELAWLSLPFGSEGASGANGGKRGSTL